ncbi:hypothetical protein KSD_33270 [Ktedonobacter sp. SOSP1-85]|uniref:Uncharacterized protein n=1 Tax=Ktedonobacter robiniae TaxID=2778365 RepID=A0ABQ3UKD6_9CHLR|nr:MULTISPECIES: hypothetical protein [Ktedonobacter]GHO52857.1 hypothetical protein KSB_13320 [Ktedonobacter robiniae]GHO66442.1 hypothetical protein KSC_053340 [Ktedonobacter sp. SOSP1-52]GHO75556.1 hypothetical protein KSD_33270 [Ktedonobacter sp. SOSP1-85]
MMHRATSLGLNERVERVLAYALFWVSGLFFFFLEKNRRVRWHALQSLITFGALSLVIYGVGMLRAMLNLIPLLRLITNFGLGLFIDMLWWAWALLWIWLMIMAWVKPDYRLPFVGEWVRHIV